MPRLGQIERYVDRSLLYNFRLRKAVSEVINDIAQIQNSNPQINLTLRKLKNQLAFLYQMMCVTELETLTDNEN